MYYNLCIDNDSEEDDNDIPLNYTPEKPLSNNEKDINEDASEIEMEEEIIEDFDNVRSTDSNLSDNEHESKTESEEEIVDDFDNVRSTDSSISDDEVDRDELDRDNLLYPGAPITVAESLLAILTVAFTHSLTGECLSSILQLIALHCIGNIKINTLYKFRKYFVDIGKHILVLHYYCLNCFVPLTAKDSVCKYCQSKSGNSFFIELPLLNQLQAMFLRPNFVKKLQFRFHRVKKASNNIEDIYDGRVYKRFFGNGGFLDGKSNISFMWYSDGISIFHSSHFSIWPMYLVINELPYRERIKKENIILAGLFFGNSKPNPNLFLAPIHSHLQEFFADGHLLNTHNGDQIRVHGKVLCGTCDLQAKGLFMRFKLYNGYYGCSRCKIRGIRHRVGKSTVQVYPYERIHLRTQEEVQNYAKISIELGKPAKGVKGPSLLSNIMPDMISGMGIDIMHGIFLGLTKLLLRLWFDPLLANELYSLSGMLHVIDARLTNMRPPSFVQRMPRAIKTHLSLWKAQEYKLWLIYYSVPILLGIMNERYFNHHLQLLSAIYLLSQDSISFHQVEVAKNHLHLYVSKFAELYGVRNMSMNVHQLLHLPDVVLDLGPLWVYSCFFLEDLNGKLSKLIHGTRHAGLQVCSGASIYMNLSVLIGTLPVDSRVRKFCEQLRCNKKKNRIVEIIDPKTYVLGSLEYLTQVPYNIRAILIDNLGINNGNIQIFYRLEKKGILFSSANYSRSNKKVSHYVLYTYGNESYICMINQFIRWSDCNCNRQCRCLPARFICIGISYKKDMWYVHDVPGIRLSYLSQVHSTGQYVAFDVGFLDCLCFHMVVDGKEFIAQPINSLEKE